MEQLATIVAGALPKPKAKPKAKPKPKPKAKAKPKAKPKPKPKPKPKAKAKPKVKAKPKAKAKPKPKPKPKETKQKQFTRYYAEAEAYISVDYGSRMKNFSNHGVHIVKAAVHKHEAGEFEESYVLIVKIPDTSEYKCIYAKRSRHGTIPKYGEAPKPIERWSPWKFSSPDWNWIMTASERINYERRYRAGYKHLQD